ncbi:hypothetical protein BB050_01478 [Flavobacterium anhuiense]|uniref:DUF1778 domain-containing protein n=1 Tax=Flavobacterium anhuiense TaxID=459526 RepID=A0AAC9GHL3_9FLAO|nr:DUF1778 domain-containing protein [Flavobacterium anhuiense]AOC94605.1 hypothetical protein BB050_01478 [Flavobacterium anhuiense]
MSHTINDRIDVRISKEQKELIKYASVLRGFKNLTEFVVYCANAEATKIIKENEIVLQSFRDKQIFLDTILNPPLANDNLKRAQMNHFKFIEANETDD